MRFCGDLRARTEGANADIPARELFGDDTHRHFAHAEGHRTLQGS